MERDQTDIIGDLQVRKVTNDDIIRKDVMENIPKMTDVKLSGCDTKESNYEIIIKALLDSLLCSIENNDKESIMTSQAPDCLEQISEPIENNDADSFVNINDESLFNEVKVCRVLTNNNDCTDDFSKLSMANEHDISLQENTTFCQQNIDMIERNILIDCEIIGESIQIDPTDKEIDAGTYKAACSNSNSVTEENALSCHCIDIQNVIFPKSWVMPKQVKKQRNYFAKSENRKNDFVYCGLENIKSEIIEKDTEISLASCIKVETPTQACDIPQDILYSGVIEFTGTKDYEDYQLIILYSDPYLWQRYNIGCIALARFLLYTVSGLPKISLLIDARTTDHISTENIFESLAIFKTNMDEVGLKIFILVENNTSLQENISDIFSPKCYQIIKNLNALSQFIDKDNLPLKFGGNLKFSNAEWIQNRLVVDAFVVFCGNVWHNFERETMIMTSQSLPDDAMATKALLADHNDDMQRLLDDKQLRNLQNRGQRILQQLSQGAGNDARCCAEKVHSSYTSANQAVSRFVHVADERLLSLERHLLVKEFEQSCEKILKWSKSCKSKLDNFHIDEESFDVLKSQQINFESFYHEAITQYAKCDNVLNDAEHLNELGYLDQGVLLAQRSKLMKDEIRSLIAEMDGKKLEIDTVTHMYKFIDQAYSWALDGMKFVAVLNMDSCCTVEACSRMLEQFDIYMEKHPPIQQCEFDKIMAMCSKYNNIKCLRQCEFAQQKCAETTQLFFKRRELLAKAKSQLKKARKRSTIPSQNNHSDSPKKTDSAQNNHNDSAQNNNSDTVKNNDSAENSRRTSILSKEFTSEGAISNDSALGTMSGDETSDFITTAGDSASAEVVLKSRSSPTFQSPALTHTVAAPTRHSRKFLKKSATMPTNQLARSLNQSGTERLTIGSPLPHGGMRDTGGKSKVDLAIEELISSEREFVKSLNFVIENYIPEMGRLDIPEALRCKRNIIFGNLEKIHDFHSHFFLKDLEKCHGNPSLVAKTFQAHRESFGLYALYSKNKPLSDKLLFEHGNQFFNSKQILLGDKMDLASYLLKPVQRMGKYALLLHAMAKRCIGSEERSLRAAEDLVKYQLRHGNDLLTMDSIRGCDVNLREQGSLLRQEEFVIFTGRRKLVRRVFLFEEMILFSKPIRVYGGHDVYQSKNSYKTAEIGLTENIGDSGFRFEIWFRRRRQQDTFILQSMNKSTKWQWVEEIKGLLWKQALKNRDHRKHEMSSMGVGNKPHIDLTSTNTIVDRSVVSNFARCRSSVATTDFEQNSTFNSKRPHSAISTSSSASSGGSGGNLASALALAGFEARPPVAYRTINEDAESVESSQNDDSSLQSINEDNESNTSSHAGQYVTSV